MSLPSWLSLIAQFAPFILAAIPGVPPGIIPFVAAGIQSAETIPGATGPQKLTAAVAIAQAGFGAAQAAGAHVNATVISDNLPAATSAVVNIVNAFQKQQGTPSAPPMPPPTT